MVAWPAPSTYLVDLCEGRLNQSQHTRVPVWGSARSGVAVTSDPAYIHPRG
jgi:hypothetical protein